MAVLPTANALTGDTKLACEAVLCLSSSTRPSECTPSLNKYFSIKSSRPDKMIKKRLNFLNLCPTAHENPEMKALVAAISQGAGRCDSDFLNQNNKKTVTYVETVNEWRCVDSGDSCTNRYVTVEKVKEKTVISSDAPNYCSIYQNHEFTDLTTAKYVGEEINGGKWVSPGDYDRALQEYNDNLQPQNQNNLPWDAAYGNQ